MSEEIDTTMARNRMERMTDLYDNLEDILDRSFNTVNKYINQIQGDVDEFDLPGDLPINVPDKVKGQLKGWINELSDEENFEQVKEIILDELMHDEKLQHTVEAIKGERPPRIMVLGRTGKGKSALINAICGEYVVETDPVHSVGIEGGVQRKEISIDEATNFELLDTEGYAEIADEKDETAREKLKQNIKEFHPDAILFVTNINDRDSFDNDTEVLSSTLEDLGGDIAEIPLITVLTHADQLPPNSLPLEEKQEEIGGRIEEIEELLEKREISANDIIPVSSRIDWSEDRPWELSEWGDVTIEQDHRENIDELIEAIADNIADEAAFQFLLLSQVNLCLKRFTDRFIHAFGSAGFTVAQSGIPLSDFPILLLLEMILVILIAYLSGRQIEVSVLTEMTRALGYTGLIGYASYLTAQFFSSLSGPLGTIFQYDPLIAYAGIWSIGMVARDYFVFGVVYEKKAVNYLWEIFQNTLDTVRSREESPGEVSTDELPDDLPSSNS